MAVAAEDGEYTLSLPSQPVAARALRANREQPSAGSRVRVRAHLIYTKEAALARGVRCCGIMAAIRKEDDNVHTSCLLDYS